MKSPILEECDSSRNGVCSVGGRAVRPDFSIKAVQVGINSDVSRKLCSLVGIAALSVGERV